LRPWGGIGDDRTGRVSSYDVGTYVRTPPLCNGTKSALDKQISGGGGPLAVAG